MPDDSVGQKLDLHSRGDDKDEHMVVPAFLYDRYVYLEYCACLAWSDFGSFLGGYSLLHGCVFYDCVCRHWFGGSHFLDCVYYKKKSELLSKQSVKIMAILSLREGGLFRWHCHRTVVPATTFGVMKISKNIIKSSNFLANKSNPFPLSCKRKGVS